MEIILPFYTFLIIWAFISFISIIATSFVTRGKIADLESMLEDRDKTIWALKKKLDNKQIVLNIERNKQRTVADRINTALRGSMK